MVCKFSHKLIEDLLTGFDLCIPFVIFWKSTDGTVVVCLREFVLTERITIDFSQTEGTLHHRCVYSIPPGWLDSDLLVASLIFFCFNSKDAHLVIDLVFELLFLLSFRSDLNDLRAALTSFAAGNLRNLSHIEARVKINFIFRIGGETSLVVIHMLPLRSQASDKSVR